MARGEIVTEAISQATKTLDAQKAELAHTIHQDIVSQVKRDLGLYPVTGTIFDRQANNARTERASVAPSFLTKIRSKFKRTPPPSPIATYETNIPQVRNPQVSAADIALAKSINPLAAPYRACPSCGDAVPLTFSNCAVCGTEMPALPKPQEDQPDQGNPFQAGE